MFYGLEYNKVVDAVVSSVGRQKGYKFLFNVAQYDHCDAFTKYRGDGLMAFFHDNSNVLPSLSVLSETSLMPGFKINILLKPTIFKRQTSHLGYCNEPMYRYYSRNTYFKSICINLCVIRKTLETCKCLPSFAHGAESLLKEMGLNNVSKYLICPFDPSTVKCIKEEMFNSLRFKNPAHHCKECKEACFETKYESLVTYERFPPVAHLAYYQKLLNNTMNITNFKKNYLLLEISLESMMVLEVLETQFLTTKDVFVYIGGTLALFLGMSFMSCGEIAVFLIRLIHLNIESLLTEEKKTPIKQLINVKSANIKCQNIPLSSLYDTENEKDSIEFLVRLGKAIIIENNNSPGLVIEDMEKIQGGENHEIPVELQSKVIELTTGSVTVENQAVILKRYKLNKAKAIKNKAKAIKKTRVKRKKIVTSNFLI